MKPAPTLMDAVYRASFRNETNPGWRSNSDMRHALEGARRFVMDEPMARFLAELANEAFVKRGPHARVNVRIADSLRVQSRLPHAAIWVEYPLRPYQCRSHELRDIEPPIERELPILEGWLIQQHPKIENAHIVHIFTQDDKEDSNGYTLFTFPIAYGWVTDDNPLPWRTLGSSSAPLEHELWAPGGQFYASANAVGIGGYQRDNVGYVHSPLIRLPFEQERDSVNSLLSEWTGVIRRVWAFLATVDNLPIIKGEVRQSKGFLARGRIRKYLSHATITLNVPAKKDTRVIARQMIAMAHRKRHAVRGHWRDDWRNPPSRRCNPHLWEPVDDNADLIRCELCHGRQFYIHAHERGDAGLGYVTHDYVVKHEENDHA